MNKVFDAYAEYYDRLNKDKDYEKEVGYILDLLSNQRISSGSILDLGCGTGIHAEFLARKGFSIHGIDISAEMIETASNRGDRELSKRLKFEVDDIKSCRLDKKFDAVLSLFHVASYQTTNDDLLSMFLTASEHLNTEGILIFDFWYGPAVLTDKPEVRVKRFQDESTNILRIAEPEIYFNENVVDVNYTIMVSRKSAQKTEILSEKHSMRYFFLPELLNTLKLAGMELIISNEWLSKESLSEKSWQGVIVAKKII